MLVGRPETDQLMTLVLMDPVQTLRGPIRTYRRSKAMAWPLTTSVSVAAAGRASRNGKQESRDSTQALAAHARQSLVRPRDLVPGDASEPAAEQPVERKRDSRGSAKREVRERPRKAPVMRQQPGLERHRINAALRDDAQARRAQGIDMPVERPRAKNRGVAARRGTSRRCFEQQQRAAGRKVRRESSERGARLRRVENVLERP